MPWQHDFFEIDLSKVPTPSLDPHWTMSKSYPRAHMQQWIDHLQEIQRLCLERGYTHSDLQQMRESPIPHERALGETYHKFYDSAQGGPGTNHDFIKVEWRDDHYEIINGQHRIWLAQQRGLRHLPAHVSAPDAATLARLRTDGERVAPGEHPRHNQETPLWERAPMPGRERGAYRERR